MASAWVIDTVDYGLRQSSCRAMWDLRTWYANLRTSVGATEREQQTAARRKYQTATKILSSVPKDFAGWITSWEMATNHALVRKTGGVEDPNTWFEDLTRAIQPIFGGWVTIYAGIYKDKLEEKTLTIGEVAKDLRKEAERRDLLGLQEKGSRLTRGVFGPTFATGQSQSMLPQLEATPSNEEGDTQTRNQATVAIEIGFRFSVLQETSWQRYLLRGPAILCYKIQKQLRSWSSGLFWAMHKIPFDKNPTPQSELTLPGERHIDFPSGNDQESTLCASPELRLLPHTHMCVYTCLSKHRSIKCGESHDVPERSLPSHWPDSAAYRVGGERGSIPTRIKLYQSARRAGVPGPLGASYGRSAPAYSRAGLGQPITSYPTQSVGD
ncbi:hypothetical protein CGGC5_v016917 [Colletotrichum fructicola Nara gc5]|uniref:Uncharacterized protein n=1 Tax=Colletotrichum fructicola (strain Nara gc5) TaxID=1213859 RepID=A0A7J6IDQ3_COLFN|nr:hypothetical protein CGGC5_v016917 [Colletotrichum fructicola Nara gc5]